MWLPKNRASTNDALCTHHSDIVKVDQSEALILQAFDLMSKNSIEFYFKLFINRTQPYNPTQSFAQQAPPGPRA
ncbi:hypothetical protein L6R29_05100 [Myxococcota bacterium]|nr:hypothetical protein [Myxococcota bacterium]